MPWQVCCRSSSPPTPTCPADRQYIQLEESVTGPVRSPAQLFAALVEEEGWALEYDRVRLSDGGGAVRVGEVDALLQRLRAVEEGSALIVSDWMGKEQATFAGTIALLLAKMKAGAEQVEEEKEEGGEEKAEETDEAAEGKEETEEAEKAEEEEKEEKVEQTEKADKEQEAEAEVKTEEDGEQSKSEGDKVETNEASEEPKTTEDKPATAEVTETAAADSEQPQAATTEPEPLAQQAQPPAEPTPPVTRVLTTDERISLMRQGQYTAITTLLPLLPVPSPTKLKATVDATIDRVAAMVNTREAIMAAWERFEAVEDKSGVQGRGWIAVGREGVERYAWLLVVYAYLLDSGKKVVAAAAGGDEAEADGGEAEAVPVVTFAAWLQGKPQLLQTIRAEVDSFVWNV